MEKKDKNREAVSATSVVNVPNSDGSTTPVTLKRSGNVWIDPKGEEYSTLPAPKQLKPIYGK